MTTDYQRGYNDAIVMLSTALRHSATGIDEMEHWPDRVTIKADLARELVQVILTDMANLLEQISND